MKRRIFAAALCLCLLLGGLNFRVEAASLIANGECGYIGDGGSNIRWWLDSDGTLTISGSGRMGTKFAAYNGKQWDTICDSVKNVVINSGVTTIAMFGGCENVTSITVPKTVTRIASGTFWGCKSLTSVAIPEGVTKIESTTFMGCTNLVSITIPDGVTSIESQAFEGCKSLTNIAIPKNVASIQVSAFRDCTSLLGIWVDADNAAYSNDDRGVLFDKNKTTLICCPSGLSDDYTIPSTVKSIGNSAFYGCVNLTDVTISNSVKSIESSAFFNCTALTSVTIPKSVTSIKNHTFYGCTALTGVVIPDSVASIESCAFYDCTGLTSVVVPDSVTNIGDDAFLGCASLTSACFKGNAPMPQPTKAIISNEQKSGIRKGSNRASTGKVGALLLSVYIV